MLKKNQEITLEITGTTAEGSGVGHYDSIAIFVPFAVVGDTITAKILKTKKTYAFAKIEKILIPSKHRIKHSCPQFSKCGGCVFQHIDYEFEKQIKEQRVKDAITRIAGLDAEKVTPIIGAPCPEHYRNKAQIPVRKATDGSICMGFFAKHSHRIVPYESCLLQPAVFDHIVKIIYNWMIQYKVEPYDESNHTGVLRHIYMRLAEVTGEIMVCLVINSKTLNYKEELIQCLKTDIVGLKSVVINFNLEKTNVIMGDKCETIFGSPTITDKLCGLSFEISPLSFYQVNRTQAEILYRKAQEYAELNNEDILLDLYCGTGTIGLSMAKSIKKLIGIEIVESAIKDAKKNAQVNGINNAEFFCADAVQTVNILEKKKINPNVVILDPPRKGCDAALIETISNKICPEKIIYISCDPATLARDLKLFDEKNYRLLKLTPVDLFPRTSHIEAVVLLRRENVDDHICFSVGTEDPRGM